MICPSCGRYRCECMGYAAQLGVFVGRPPCSNCGAAYRLHADQRCPVAYRPSTLEVAQRELSDAEASGDAARIFVARGEVQRLGGRPWDELGTCGRRSRSAIMDAMRDAFGQGTRGPLLSRARLTARVAAVTGGHPRRCALPTGRHA